MPTKKLMLLDYTMRVHAPVDGVRKVSIKNPNGSVDHVFLDKGIDPMKYLIKYVAVRI